MAKKFFVNVSPKAAEGIRRAYAKIGAEVHAQVGSNGQVTVVVIPPSDVEIASSPSRKPRSLEVAA